MHLQYSERKKKLSASKKSQVILHQKPPLEYDHKEEPVQVISHKLLQLPRGSFNNNESDLSITNFHVKNVGGWNEKEESVSVLHPKLEDDKMESPETKT